jgi:hypothetical protein
VIKSKFDNSFGNIENVSESCQTMFGFSRESMLNRDIHDIMPSYFTKGHARCVKNWVNSEI